MRWFGGECNPLCMMSCLLPLICLPGGAPKWILRSAAAIGQHRHVEMKGRTMQARGSGSHRAAGHGDCVQRFLWSKCQGCSTLGCELVFRPTRVRLWPKECPVANWPKGCSRAVHPNKRARTRDKRVASPRMAKVRWRCKTTRGQAKEERKRRHEGGVEPLALSRSTDLKSAPRTDEDHHGPHGSKKRSLRHYRFPRGPPP